MNKPFYYKVHLVPLEVINNEQSVFRDNLNSIPYLLYEVELLKNGNKIVINKPGGKRNFGKLARNDFMVFIYNTKDSTLWLISHKEIIDDLYLKNQTDKENTLHIIKGLKKVCEGSDPDTILQANYPKATVGLSVEEIFKVYKWIWGQEDCNYPKGKGRWLSMNAILEKFGLADE